MIQGLSRQANTGREALPEVFSAKDQRIAQLERELKEAKLKAAGGGGSAEQVEQVKGLTLVTAAVEGLEGNALRELMDQVRTRHPSAVIALTSKVSDAKVAALISVSPDLAQDAGALFKAMLPALGGRGGGKRDLAQGGGTNPGGIPQAFEALRAAL
jgi:alanyl-tRNA synthetase